MNILQEEIRSIMKSLKFYWQLFAATFTLSAFTVGGGYVIVPLMRKKFVEENHWLEEEEMLDITALSQSCPGPIAVNCSVMAGYRMAGVPGALVTAFGTVLPPLVIISVISLFYAAFRDNAVVSAVLRGMQAGVAAVIVDVVIGMGAAAGKGPNYLNLFIMAVCFVAAVILKVNVAAIIIVCGVLGAIRTIYTSRKAKGGSA